MIAGSRKPRIAICGTGRYGCLLASMALEKGWTVAAAFNRAGSKVGQDLGRLAGLGRDIGVIVQDCETADYGDLQADIGIVVQTNTLSINYPAYERFMNAGLNVMCHGTEAYYPVGNNPGLTAEIDSLARKNGVTFSGSGIWDMSRIWAGIMACAPCTDIRSIHHRSMTDMKGQGTAKQNMEFGVNMTVEEYLGKGIDKHPLWPTYRTVPEAVLAALGYTVTRTSYRVFPITYDEPLEDTEGYLGFVVPAGRVVGTGMVGLVETREGVTGRIDFEGRMAKPGEIERMHWSIEGNPRNIVITDRLDPDYLTMACLFGRIPQVIAAKPGVVTLTELGPLMGPLWHEKRSNLGIRAA